VRGIQVAPDAIRVTAEGTNEMIDKVPTLTGIHVRYTLRVGRGTARDKVDRALETHVSKCPTARSLRGAVEVTWAAEIEEEDLADA
jgi:uncharacterized OsmC-like protein